MRGRSLLTLALVAASLPVAVAADIGCHQAAFVGPVKLEVEPLAPAALGAVGEVLLTDGTVLSDGQSIPVGAQVLRGVFRNLGVTPIDVTLASGDHVRLAPQQTVSVASAREIENERICVCECTCGAFDTVQIRCDSSTMDCSQLNGSTCEDDDGVEQELEGCEKKFVKPAEPVPAPVPAEPVSS